MLARGYDQSGRGLTFLILIVALFGAGGYFFWAPLSQAASQIFARYTQYPAPNGKALYSTSGQKDLRSLQAGEGTGFRKEESPEQQTSRIFGFNLFSSKLRNNKKFEQDMTSVKRGDVGKYYEDSVTVNGRRIRTCGR